MRTTLVLLLLAATAAPGVAWAKYDYCYWNRDSALFSQPVPTGVEVTPDDHDMKRSGFIFWYGMVPTLYRLNCDVADESDKKLARLLYQSVGCTAESSLGASVEAVLSGSVKHEGYGFIELLREENFSDYKKLCQAAAAIPIVVPPDGVNLRELNKTDEANW